MDPILINHDGSDEAADATTDRVYSKQPAVRVGNILGEKGGVDGDANRAYTQYYGPDTVDRTFTVLPADVYEGESNKTFTITFEAKGPMYGSSIVIPIPAQLRPFPADLILPETLASYLADHITVTASGRVQPSGKLDVGILATDEVIVGADGLVTIPFTRIDNGAKVVLSYEFEGAPDYPTSMILNDGKTAVDDLATDANESITTEVSAFADAEGAGGNSNKLPLITVTVPDRTTGTLPNTPFPQHRLLVVISVREQDLER